jgi:hypothetical protein
MSTENQIQELLKKKYLQGPKYRMDEQKQGIQFTSVADGMIYYELWGEQDIFRVVIVSARPTLFTTHYVGKSPLVLLLGENDQYQGGFISSQAPLQEELHRVFPQLHGKSVKELTDLIQRFVLPHLRELEGEEKERS